MPIGNPALAANATQVLFAWANPLSSWHQADHTWVTDFDSPFACPPPSHYWYCWGICHPTGPGTTARPLLRAAGDIAAATCICRPDDPAAHGGIDLYGVHGVCHQLANRVLYAASTGGTPPTVVGAHKYWLSQALFGTYGLTHADWRRRKKSCFPPSTIMGMTSEGGPPDDDAALLEALRSRLGESYTEGTGYRVLQLRNETRAQKRLLDKLVQDGEISGREFANRANEIVSRFVTQLELAIGRAATTAVFNSTSEETSQLVDPEVADKVNYTKKDDQGSDG